MARHGIKWALLASLLAAGGNPCPAAAAAESGVSVVVSEREAAAGREGAASREPVEEAVAAAPRRPVSGEIRRGGARGGTGTELSGGGAGSGGALWETGRLLAGLGVVLGVILAMRYGAGKWLGLKGPGTAGNRGVRVLSRTLMGPRQQLVLLQVGRKLVLVSDAGGRVSPVTEVADPDEVAELTAQVLGDGSKEAAGGFASMLGLKSLGFSARDDGAERDADLLEPGERDPAEDETRGAGEDRTITAELGLSMLADRVRGLSARMAAGTEGGRG